MSGQNDAHWSGASEIISIVWQHAVLPNPNVYPLFLVLPASGSILLNLTISLLCSSRASVLYDGKCIRSFVAAIAGVGECYLRGEMVHAVEQIAVRAN